MATATDPIIARPQPESFPSVPDISKAAVLRELEDILASQPFRNSRRSKQFLSYVIQHKLEGRDDLLKERTIGIEIFQRKPGYATGDDPVVRVQAGRRDWTARSQASQRREERAREAMAGRGRKLDSPCAYHCFRHGLQIVCSNLPSAHRSDPTSTPSLAPCVRGPFLVNTGFAANPSVDASIQRTPRRHGPYAGKKKKGDIEAVPVELANYKKFRRLIQQWIGLTVQIDKLKPKRLRRSLFLLENVSLSSSNSLST